MSQPFFFGPRSRRLFGIYTPPARRPVDRGVVLCNPWGQEYLRAHRSLRMLADAMAGRGLHVLRFDGFGAGDSEGDGADVSLDGWTEDAVLAVSELRCIAGVGRIGLVGLRLGAVVAAAAAAGERCVGSLALWDPVVDGKAYLEELKALAAAHAHPRGAHGNGAGPGPVEVEGFPLSGALRSEIAGLDLEGSAESASARILLAVTEETDGTRGLGGSLRDRLGERFEYAFRPGPRAWQQELDFGAGAVPSALLESLASWSW